MLLTRPDIAEAGCGREAQHPAESPQSSPLAKRLESQSKTKVKHAYRKGTEILKRLEHNTILFPVFVIDVCPPKEDFPVEGAIHFPASGSLKAQDKIVLNRLAQQKAELSEVFCQMLLGYINNLSPLRSVGYIINKVDLLDHESQNNILQCDLPLLKYLRKVSDNEVSGFKLYVQTGSALTGLNVRRLFRNLTEKN